MFIENRQACCLIFQYLRLSRQTIHAVQNPCRSYLTVVSCSWKTASTDAINSERSIGSPGVGTSNFFSAYMFETLSSKKSKRWILWGSSSIFFILNQLNIRNSECRATVLSGTTRGWSNSMRATFCTPFKLVFIPRVDLRQGDQL